MSSTTASTKEILTSVAVAVGALVVLSVATNLLTGSVTAGFRAFGAGIVAIAFSLYLFRDRLEWGDRTE